MDFVVRLPKSKGFDAIWVVVNRLSKQRHFVPCMMTIDAEGLARLFNDNVFRLHRLLNSIVATVDLSLPKIFGDTSVPALALQLDYLLPFTHRLMDKPKGSTPRWRNTFVHMLITYKMTGYST